MVGFFAFVFGNRKALGQCLNLMLYCRDCRGPRFSAEKTMLPYLFEHRPGSVFCTRLLGHSAEEIQRLAVYACRQMYREQLLLGVHVEEIKDPKQLFYGLTL